jgi:hypothetical protein
MQCGTQSDASNAGTTDVNKKAGKQRQRGKLKGWSYRFEERKTREQIMEIVARNNG